MIDFDEIYDRFGESPGDEVAVRGRIRVRVVGGLIGEVLDEQEVVHLRGIAVNTKR